MTHEQPPAVRHGTVGIVMLTHRAPGQVARLVSRLEKGRDVVVAVHHDPQGEELRLRTSSSVVLVPDPVPCPWGVFSRTEAIRRSLQWLRANVPTLTWALVISGQDYPIRTMTAIEDELAAAHHDGFVRHFRLDSDPADDVHHWQTTARQRYLYRRRLPGSIRSVRLPWRRRLPFPDGIGLYAGEQWVNLSVRAVDKLLETPLIDPLLRFLRRAPLPDEAAVATLLMGGDPELSVVNDRRRYIRWPGGTPHPALIAPADLPLMLESNAFFARKVDLAAWPEACEALDDLAESRSC